MDNFSIVIICRNEIGVIARTLQSLYGITDDIVVYDNGSTDGTQKLVRQFDVNLCEGSWDGFGKTKNKANNLAKYDWIFSLDADEAVDEELKQSLLRWKPENNTVYDILFRNFLGDKCLKYGEWGRDHHIRFFNKRLTRWDDASVHEKLIMPDCVEVKRLKGYVLHYTMKDIPDYAVKMVKYAMLIAERYYGQGKKVSWFKIQLSPSFTFLNYYVFKLGFFDGHAGYICAKMTAYYTFMKYTRLKELHQARGMTK